MSKELPKRSELSQKYKWNLKDIYKNDEHWEKEFTALQQDIKNTAEIKTNLISDAKSLLNGLEKIFNIEKRISRLYTYAHMKYDQNTKKEKYQNYNNRAMMLYNQFSNFVSFLVPKILELGEKKLNSYQTEEKDLNLYQHFFDNILRQKDHYLSENEEKIIALAGDLTQSPENIFSMLNNADLEFPILKDKNGEEKRLTHGRYIDFLKTQERTVRKNAFKAMHQEYEKLENTFAAVLNSSVKSDIFYAKARKYNDSLTASLDNDNIDVKVYNNLLKTVEKNLDPLHEYMELKKEILNLDELHIYDTYTPLISSVNLQYKYEEAKEVFKKSISPLGENYLNIVEKGLNSSWIDVYENEGKKSGAYSGGCYGIHPYILLNYTEDISNLFTLAHEMGHAVHTYYSNKNQPYIYSNYKIFVAEVASTLNENLLVDYLLDNANKKEEKLYLLNHFLEGYRGTVYRQTMFAEFEKTIHEMVEASEPLTVQSLKNLYKNLNTKYFGKLLTTDKELEVEWARIPHFYYNFYVYKYATGYSAAAALAEKISKESNKAAEKYINFLKAGGSDYPLNILKKAGVDMTVPDPIKKSVNRFEHYLKMLKDLI